MTRDFIETINDYEEAYGTSDSAGGNWGRLAFNNMGLARYGSRMSKIDAPMLTTTSGVRQPIVGPQIWANLNTERSLFAALRGKEWSETGIRVITAYPGTKIRGVAEATSPVGDTVLPSFSQYFPTIKIMETPFNQSLISMYHGKIAENVTWEQFRDFMGINHAKGINQTFNATNATPASNDFESIDRIVAANAEIGVQTGVGANDLDIFGLDRDAGASFADAQILQNANTDRDLSLRLLNTLRRVTMNASGDYNPANYFWYTGLDTYQNWTELLQPQQRFDEKTGSFSPLNGVHLGTEGTKETTFLLSVYDSSPIILSQDAPKTSDTLSRVFMIHKDHTWKQIVQPTVYRQVGVGTGQELLTSTYTNEGLFYTVAELVTNFFGANGKLMDLK